MQTANFIEGFGQSRAQFILGIIKMDEISLWSASGRRGKTNGTELLMLDQHPLCPSS